MMKMSASLFNRQNMNETRTALNFGGSKQAGKRVIDSQLGPATGTEYSVDPEQHGARGRRQGQAKALPQQGEGRPPEWGRQEEEQAAPQPSKPDAWRREAAEEGQ
jgi:hypothetical protein